MKWLVEILRSGYERWKSGKAFRRMAIIGATLAAIVSILNWIVFPLPTDRLHPPTSTFIFSREGRLLNRFASRDGYWRLPVPLSQISPLMVKSVLTNEDRWYYWHPGFNPVALVSAALTDIKAGRIVRGGSTISMQVARMMEPKERTIPNKIAEIYRALQLEMRYSKKELLELYFNLAPYGGNIEGIGAASYLYFDKPPSQLTLSEIAILTALPASPTRFRPDKNLDLCAARRARVLATLARANVISSADYAQALREEIPVTHTSAPVAAPHFCQTVMAAHPGTSKIISTIDYRLQIICERLARNYQAQLAEKGIHNLSAVVLDNRTGELLAMIGSADFGDTENHGQVNGALAPRSPGSALKPFVYAIGFEKGLITPALKVEDLPINYAGYIPINYDEQYHGIVSISEALIQSLNVPAVNLTSRVGLTTLVGALKAGGISTLTRKDADYGLPLILGSGEVNLVELSNLYATLARGGNFLPVRTLKSENESRPARVFSPQSSYLVTQILAELKRPDLPSSWEFTPNLPRVAWKTGTSYGRKDAWAVGYDPDYTVGVWAGNFSAEGSIAIVGADISAPLMFDIFNQLRQNGQNHWFEMPPGIELRAVCAVSGQVVGEACPDKIGECHIPGVSPSTVCTVHHERLVDRSTGNALCTRCASGKEVGKMVVESWPPRMSAWLLSKGMLAAAPPHNPDCGSELAGDGPVITSPERDAVFILRPKSPKAYQQILFQASAPADARRVYWFLDGQFFASASNDSAVFYAPVTGKHELLCLDVYGRSSCLTFRVE
ncbi:MAG: penicillin-binding protein 1C [candidate division Zixibacteria bacterium]|nr:penicillin-binding protein 1C [candidate division Zixibacteria bacterium]